MVLYIQLYVTEQRKDEDYDDVVEESLLNEVSTTATNVVLPCGAMLARYMLSSCVHPSQVGVYKGG